MNRTVRAAACAGAFSTRCSRGAVWRGQQRSIHHLDAKWIEKWASSGSAGSDASAGPDASPRSSISSEASGRSAAKYYQLPMFPYPSGRLHIGHLRVYTISDTLARFRRMNGFNVIHPIGWDAFGLPAENAAIQHGINAADWTYKHIDLMREQLRRMMISFDWDREVITCSPDYYKHTQRIFLGMYKAGLAYRRSATVNWDPVDQTVLANEQIDSHGKSWRSGAIAEKRELEQWFLKITEYAQELQDDLQLLENWPDKVKRMQQQWIGLSEGAEVKFSNDLWAFTTKIETLPGVKFIAIAEDHPLVLKHAADTRPNGLVEGLEAVNPLTGEPIPVYTAPYVISGYGSGVVMGVPAHDERDRSFWESVCGADAVDSLQPVVDVTADKMVSGGDGLAGLSISDARKAILDTLESQSAGRAVSHMRLHDWLVSRQRFWGAPIPMVHCDNCGIVPVPESQLPVELPKDTKNVPLSLNKEWLETTCPECGGPAHRDPDTMDTFMDSSWYYFRYLDPHNTELPFANEAVSGKMPVDCYVGGVEHAILHLLYSRFLAKFLARAGKWDGGDLNGEPFKKLVTQGMVHGKTYREKATGRYLQPEELAVLKEKLQTDSTAMDHLEMSMEKMSKSKYNGVDPLEVIDEHGSDATRAHMLFQASVEDTLDWDDDKIVGVERWLAKIQSIGTQLCDGIAANKLKTSSPSSSDIKAWNQICNLVGNITTSILECEGLNTVISDYMKVTKNIVDLTKSNPGIALQAYEVLLKIIAPVCPAQADELWEQLLAASGKKWTSVHSEAWPDIKPLEADASQCEYKVLINSRPLKKPLLAPAEASEQELLSHIDLQGKEVARVIYKPKIRLLSVITK